MKKLVLITFLTAIASLCPAAYYFWDNSAGNGYYDGLTNWDPDLTAWDSASDYMVDDTDTYGKALIDQYVDVKMNRFKLATAVDGDAEIDMTAGKVFAERIYLGTGTNRHAIFKQTGGEFMSNKNVNLGYTGSEVTYNMYDGLLEYKGAWGYYLKVGADDASTVNFNMMGGEVHGHLLSFGALGKINMTGGVMKFTNADAGDYTSTLQGFIDGNKIVTDPGLAFKITYDATEVLPFAGGAYEVTGVTTLQVVPEPATMLLLSLGGAMIIRKRR